MKTLGCGIRSLSSASPSARRPAVAAGLLCLGVLAACGESNVSGTRSQPFISPLKTVSTIASTVPSNGDVNPYGTAVVPRSSGNLVAGNILVSNFNNSTNAQGTGTTIVQITPGGTNQLFAQIGADALPGPCEGGVGLTTALVVLQTGWVIVGSLPTADGTAATAAAGCLIVLNNVGQVVETLSGDPINGPWDMTASESPNTAVLFVTNVLNGTVAASPNVVNSQTVARISLSNPSAGGGGMPQESARTVIGSGFGGRTDPAALVVGPTGVGLGSDGTLYVADTLANRIAAIPNALSAAGSAGNGQTVSINGALNSPLGLTVAPNGDIVTVNGGDGNIVETTPGGSQVAVMALDTSGNPAGAGALFGLAVTPSGTALYFVDDASNTLNLLH
jgi:hypothetical protein